MLFGIAENTCDPVDKTESTFYEGSQRGGVRQPVIHDVFEPLQLPAKPHFLRTRLRLAVIALHWLRAFPLASSFT